jgi:hypothetical protein
MHHQIAVAVLALMLMPHSDGVTDLVDHDAPIASLMK